MWFSADPAIASFRSLSNAGVTLAAAASLLLYVSFRRSRYFGNTAPLLTALCLLPLMTTQTTTAPWLWSMPFLFTFIGGVFADALETRHRKLFLAFSAILLFTQATLCFLSLRGIHA